MGGASSILMDVPERSSRRRLIVFSCSFILACAVSLGYVYSRPAEYRAIARVHISPAGVVAESTDTKSPALQGDPKSFLTEVQVLTSRPLLQEVVERIRTAGKLPDLGKDPVDAVQQMLHAMPVEGTQVVELSAESSRQALVSDLVNTVAAVYREQTADAYKDQVASTGANVDDEAQTLHDQVSAKQRALDAFRDRYDIVSLDRKENDVLAKIDGLTRSYADGNAQLAKAQGNLEAFQAALAAGKPISRPRDDAAIAALETELSMLREKMRGLERRYNSAFLVLDPETKALPAQIAELEQQLKDRRAESGRAAIADAEDELSSAKVTVARLRKDIDDNQKGAREFATRLSEFKGMQEDVDHLQVMERQVLDRSTKLQSSIRERAPRVELIEAATPSLEPWRPNYRQNALISVAGSLFFGLLATWFADFLAGPAPARAMMVQHSLALPSVARYAAPALRTLKASPSDAPELHSPASQVQLLAPEGLPRELEDSEIAALIANASDDLRLAVLTLLTGLDAAEVAALRWDRIDFGKRSILIGGPSPRTLALEDPLAAALEQRQPGSEPSAPVLHDERGNPLSVEDLDRLVLFGAYDAGLERPADVNSAVLRHSYLAFLLRQGIRAADISRIAGHIPQAEMVAHMQSASPRARLPLEQIDRMHPVLRALASRFNA
ncbi:MAG TPA: tyrosine-type recombinase/integrase [Micropepsaceae bacterium]